jgi:hypothetical protein
MGQSFDITMTGTMMFGEVLVRIDALSGWFIPDLTKSKVPGIFRGRPERSRLIVAKGAISAISLNPDLIRN